MIRKFKALFLLAISLIQGLSSLVAQDNSYPLDNGMSYSDVTKVWGAPHEKQELESKREDIWIYKEGKVIFKNGLVSTWFKDGVEIQAQSNVETAELSKDSPKVDTADIPDSLEQSGLDDAAVEDILKDILREPYLEDESAQPPVANGSMSVGQAQIIQ